MVTPAMTKTETTAAFFIPSSSASPPPPSVAFKNTFTRSTNYPGEVWGLKLINVGNSADQKSVQRPLERQVRPRPNR